VLGDATYGWRYDTRLPKPPRIMLHAARLDFVHPVTGDAVMLRAPLPEDFVAWMEQARQLPSR
jgi:23S rRNA-/tRNA-specific pseudouridylate synthase